jgi:hypothetical protein
MSKIIAHLLYILAFQFVLFESAVLYPKLRRRKISSSSASISVEENDNNDEKDYGQKRRNIVDNEQSDDDGAIGQFLDHLKTFFMAAAKNVAHPPNGDQQRLNNCFFTPMNCQIAGGQNGIGGIGNNRRRDGQRVAAIFVLSDEERTKFMERQKQWQNEQHKLRAKRKKHSKNGKKGGGRKKMLL